MVDGRFVRQRDGAVGDPGSWPLRKRPRLVGSELCRVELRGSARLPEAADGAELGDRSCRRKDPWCIRTASGWLLGVARTSRRSSEPLRSAAPRSLRKIGFRTCEELIDDEAEKLAIILIHENSA